MFRLLLLVVSMGFGVVKPTLGGITSKVLLLGVIYFVATEALELVEHLGNINDFSGKTMIFLVIPVALLDACFILWIFSSLARTLEKLQIKRNMAKPELYRNFTNALAISVMLSIAWIGFELYFNAAGPLSEYWRVAWIIPAFWNLLSYGLLVIICIIWAPSKNPTRYSYFATDEVSFLIESYKWHVVEIRKGGKVKYELDKNSGLVKKWWTTIIHDMMVAALVITTLVSGVLASFFLKAREKDFAHEKTSLEAHDTNDELRVLSCVYGVLHPRVSERVVGRGYKMQGVNKWRPELEDLQQEDLHRSSTP